MCKGFNDYLKQSLFEGALLPPVLRNQVAMPHILFEYLPHLLSKSCVINKCVYFGTLSETAKIDV